MALGKYPGVDGEAIKFLHEIITPETKDKVEFILSNIWTNDKERKSYLDVYRQVYSKSAKL